MSDRSCHAGCYSGVRWSAPAGLPGADPTRPAVGPSALHGRWHQRGRLVTRRAVVWLGKSRLPMSSEARVRQPAWRGSEARREGLRGVGGRCRTVQGA